MLGLHNGQSAECRAAASRNRVGCIRPSKNEAEAQLTRSTSGGGDLPSSTRTQVSSIELLRSGRDDRQPETPQECS